MESNQTLSLDDRIQSLLVDSLQVPPEQVSTDLQFGDLPQWDFMGHMEVMISLEAEFSVEINPDTIADLTSFHAIRQYLIENNNDRT